MRGVLRSQVCIGFNILLQSGDHIENIFLIKGKVAEVSEDASTNHVTVVAENAVTGEKVHQEVEMVVLATGMQPTAAADKLPADLQYSADGFIINDFEKGGMFAAGCANKPADVVSSNQNCNSSQPRFQTRYSPQQNLKIRVLNL